MPESNPEVHVLAAELKQQLDAECGAPSETGLVDFVAKHACAYFQKRL